MSGDICWSFLVERKNHGTFNYNLQLDHLLKFRQLIFLVAAHNLPNLRLDLQAMTETVLGISELSIK